jgi:hypothetical protein
LPKFLDLSVTKEAPSKAETAFVTLERCADLVATARV